MPPEDGHPGGAIQRGVDPEQRPWVGVLDRVRVDHEVAHPRRGQKLVEAGIEGALWNPHPRRRRPENPLMLVQRRQHLRPHGGRLGVEQRQVAVCAGAGHQLQVPGLGEIPEG